MPHVPTSQPIGIRDLRQQLASVVRRAKTGERVLVTIDGQAVAQLGPVTPDANGATLWDLASAGLIEPPQRHDRPAAPEPLPLPADVRAARLMEEVRRG